MTDTIPYEYTAENADKCARGEIVIFRFGRPTSKKLSKVQLAEYEEAKRRKYVIVNSRSVWLQNAYYLWCESANLPFVCVTKGPKFSRIKMDVIFYSPHYRLHQEAVHEVRALFLRERVAKVPVYAGVWSECEKIPTARIDVVASALFAIGTSPRAWPMK